MHLLTTLQAENRRLTKENEDLKDERETLIRRVLYWTSQAMDTSDSRLRAEQLMWVGRFAQEVMRCLAKSHTFDADARGWDAYDRLAIAFGMVTVAEEDGPLGRFQRAAGHLWAAGYSVERAHDAPDAELLTVPRFGKKSLANFRDYAPTWLRDHKVPWP